MKKQRMTWLLFGTLVCLLSSCMKDFLEENLVWQGGYDYAPWVETGDVAAVSGSGATLKGAVDTEKMKEVLADGETVREFGIAYATDFYTDFTSSAVTVPASTDASSSNFTVDLSGLEGSTTYFYAAYVATDYSIYFGKRQNFVTLPIDVPEPSLPEVLSKDGGLIRVKSSSEKENIEMAYSKGFCWRVVDSRYKEPTLADCSGSEHLGWFDAFEAEVPVESSDVILAIRAFVRADNTGEVSYSETLFVSLHEGTLVSPVILSDNVDGTVCFQAKLLNFEGMEVTEKGFCYSGTTASPVIDTDEKLVDDSSEDATSISVSAVGLDPASFYYVRAYCVAGGTTYYGPTYIYGTRKVGIYTLEDLIAFRDAHNNNDDLSLWKDENGVVTLYSDIDMSSVTDWTPIEYFWSNETFDGNGHFLTNFKISSSRTNAQYYGLFGQNSGLIKNLHIGEGSNITFAIPQDAYSYPYIGAICGYNNDDGSISGCTSIALIDVTSATNSASFGVGGIAGGNRGTIEGCKHMKDGVVSGRSQNAYVGGIVGRSDNGANISGCTNEGEVGLGYQCNYIGGIVAEANFINIRSCSNKGAVTAHTDTEYVGGIAGYCYGSGDNNSYSLIDQCVNSAVIKNGATYVGGIVGSIDGHVTNCVNEAGGVISTEAEYVGTICGDLGSSVNDFAGNQNEGTVNGEAGKMIGIDRRPPLVGNAAVVSSTITSTSVVLKAEILDQGGGSIQEAGFYYSTTANSWGSSVRGTVVDNVVTVTLEGLTPGTTYFVWAYVQNNHATAKSASNVSFTTALE